MKISIIIPVYNVEKYINRCLSSIYSQNIEEEYYEVIVINDGSSDNSMRTVYEYASKHCNLIVIEKENGGVSSARNEGIKTAKGEYVTFVDADDWIESGSLYKIKNYLSIHPQLDVLICHSRTENGIEKYPWQKYCKNDIEYTGVEVYKRGYRRGSVWGGVYRLNFLKQYDLKFPLGVRNGEDSIFFYVALTYINKIAFTDLPLYVVYERIGSASRSFDINHLKLVAFSLESAYQLAMKHSTSKTGLQCDILTEMLYAQITSFTNIAIRIGHFSLKQIQLYINVNKYLPLKFNESRNKKWKLLILNNSYPIFYYLVKIKSRLFSFNL